MKRILNLLYVIVFLSCISATAQENPALTNDSLTKQLGTLKEDIASIKKLQVTGWIQTQFQYAQTRGVANFEGGQFAPNSYKRFMIRRGRVKFTYNGKNTQYVFQINGTERGLNLTEIFAVATDPWIKTISITGGVMNRPFGFEIDQSSAVRESPERSRYTQILMPNERDMGAKLTIAPPKTSKFYGFRLDAGFYNGQGVYVPGTTTPAGYPGGTTPVLGVNEFDFQKDFIGRMIYYKGINDDKIKLGIGVSHYNGGNISQNNRVFEQINTGANGLKEWTLKDTTNTVFKNKTAPRIYYGGEAYLSFKNAIGITTLRGEYVSGTQSGTSGSSSSPFFLPSSLDTYIRNFNGMYAYLIHRINKHEFAVKYEWYDPNTKVTGIDILAKSNLTAADIRFDQLGFTYTYYMFDNVKFMFNYVNIINEKTGSNSDGLLGYMSDIKDNILTVRMQYRF